jgi:hypothetical protein
MLFIVISPSPSWALVAAVFLFSSLSSIMAVEDIVESIQVSTGADNLVSVWTPGLGAHINFQASKVLTVFQISFLL